MESSEETGCQAREGPILCINNCGFFGSAATMNLCSKCHKDLILKQHQAKLAQTSIDTIMNGGLTSATQKEPVIAESPTLERTDLKTEIAQPSSGMALGEENIEVKAKEGPNRCASCRKRVGLTGFDCRCGSLFCLAHRYADKHECPFDYRAAGRDAIAKSNPIIKADKLDKI